MQPRLEYSSNCVCPHVIEQFEWLQVNSAPRQSNGHDCGLFIITFCEYICSMTEGEFSLVPGRTPAPDRMVCEGPHAKFLSNKTWFEEKEVTFLRIFYQAALCDLWNGRPRSSVQTYRPYRRMPSQG